MKRTLLIFFISAIISGCGSFMNNERPSPDKNPSISIFKKTIIKKLEFLPYIDYVPSVVPTESGNTLLDELYIYEKIVDDHNQFELTDLEKHKGSTAHTDMLNVSHNSSTGAHTNFDDKYMKVSLFKSEKSIKYNFLMSNVISKLLLSN